MITVYGIKTCDTCRKALKRLDAEGKAHKWHDLRADGLSPERLDRWIAAMGWESLLNRKSTTWRGLPPDMTQTIDAAKARALMLDNPTLIKRPIFDEDGRISVGLAK